MGRIPSYGVRRITRANAKHGNGIASDGSCHIVDCQISVAIVSGSQRLLARLENKDAAVVD